MSWDNFVNEVPRKPNKGCKVCRYVKSLSKQEAKSFQSVLDNQAYSATSIWRGLRTRGVQVAKETVSAHRRGKCGGDE